MPPGGVLLLNSDLSACFLSLEDEKEVDASETWTSRRRKRRSRGLQSLRQVVEAHRDADVAGEADVDAEVDQPLLAGPCDTRRHRTG